MNRRNVLGVVVVIALLSGSMLAQIKKTRNDMPGAAQPSQIAREARHELMMLPYYSLFDWLEFKVDGNRVTLMGEVTDPTLKKDAENIVKKIDGVESVQNNIEVLPLSPDDDRIRLAEYRTIYGFDGLYRYGLGPLPSIHIIVKNGHVTLKGAVDSEADKNLVELQAKSVAGVFDVQNELTVSGSSRPH